MIFLKIIEEYISAGNHGELLLEPDIKTFVAGVPICGKKLKHLRLECDPGTVVELVEVYGKYD